MILYLSLLLEKEQKIKYFDMFISLFVNIYAYIVIIYLVDLLYKANRTKNKTYKQIKTKKHKKNTLQVLFVLPQHIFHKF